MAAGADEADVVNKPGEAEVHEAEEAEADEVDVADDTEDVAEATDANKADEVKAKVEVTDANGADESDTTEVNEANDADEANVTDKADEAESNEASLAKANKLLANCGIAVVVKYSSKLLCHDTIIICVNVLSQFSLTKYSVFVAEVKGYFGINNNQLGGPLEGNEINNQLAELEMLDVAKGRDE